MFGDDSTFSLIRRDLRVALALELFAEFGFIVAFLAVAGAFNGGRPTSTPPVALAYLVSGFLVTILVIVRTHQMLVAAERHHVAALRINVRIWALVAFAFSAILPSIYLNNAAAAMQRRL